MENRCIKVYKREVYIYIEEGKIELTTGLRSSKPKGKVTISSASEIHIMEIDEQN